MLYLKVRNGRIKVGPADERGEREVQDLIQILRQRGLSALEVETDFEEWRNPRHDGDHYHHYRDNPRGGNPHTMGAYGSPNANYQPPIVLPIMWEPQSGRRTQRRDYDLDPDDYEYRRQDGRRRQYGRDDDIDYRQDENPRRQIAKPASDESKKTAP